MLVIGENISVVARTVGKAIDDRDPEPVIKLAREQRDAGADYIDVNIGPATRNGEETMQWIVRTIQGEIDLPLALDTKNTGAIEAGLEV
ncbi:MAG: dihydropteroate synthase, partial [Clostridiaceae bacterium]|nr:dihydropteroate synthase [Clostridiaceae bacterium]